MEENSENEAPMCEASAKTPGQHRKHPNHPASPTAGSSCLSMQCFSCVRTPPAKRFHRVRNPFESALADRLHLPIIGSPSLFQCTEPPQLSSTQFEWTIDHVSSLNPAHVEPHETQFQDSPNPELEAKAQSAISSFFKDQQIVPSPVDCPLRNQRILLSELNSNTPIAKPGRRIRDCGTQTELTLPLELPPALEEALRPYFRTEAVGHSAGRSPRPGRSASSSSMLNADVSLRRKLFDMHNVVVIGESSHSPTAAAAADDDNSGSQDDTTASSSLSVSSIQRVAFTGTLSDSPANSSFGSLSPISATSNSPQTLGGEEGRKKRDFLNEMDGLELSPIVGLKRGRQLDAAPDEPKTVSLDYRSNVTVCDMSVSLVCTESAAAGERFTPDCSSSPMFGLSGSAGQRSFDGSINAKVSRLMMRDSSRVAAGSQPLDDTQDDTMDDGLMLADDEDILMSQSNSSNSDTPRSKRRSASRKNLSQSFCRNWEFDGGSFGDGAGSGKREVAAPAAAHQTADPEAEPQLVKFFRTDSGFNDMTSSQSSSSNVPCGDTLVRSSTPSTDLALQGDSSSIDF